MRRCQEEKARSDRSFIVDMLSVWEVLPLKSVQSDGAVLFPVDKSEKSQEVGIANHHF